MDVEPLPALRDSDDAGTTPSPASLIHAERACHSDPRLRMCQKVLRSGREREREIQKMLERGSVSVLCKSLSNNVFLYLRKQLNLMWPRTH